MTDVITRRDLLRRAAASGAGWLAFWRKSEAYDTGEGR